MSFRDKLLSFRGDGDSIRLISEWAIFFKKFDEVAVRLGLKRTPLLCAVTAHLAHCFPHSMVNTLLAAHVVVLCSAREPA
jgi:hypothetical protein